MAGREGSKDRQQANAAAIGILIVVLLVAMQNWKMNCEEFRSGQRQHLLERNGCANTLGCCD
jgi:hypothetical protein